MLNCLTALSVVDKKEKHNSESRNKVQGTSTCCRPKTKDVVTASEAFVKSQTHSCHIKFLKCGTAAKWFHSRPTTSWECLHWWRLSYPMSPEAHSYARIWPYQQGSKPIWRTSQDRHLALGTTMRGPTTLPKGLLALGSSRLGVDNLRSMEGPKKCSCRRRTGGYSLRERIPAI